MFWREGTCAIRNVVLVVLLMAIAPVLRGQSGTSGALTGTVKDSSGAVVPNATVTVTSIATGQARTTTTSTSGTYSVAFLPPGDYQVKFEASGFTSASVPSVTVNVTETPVLDEVLNVGTQTQQVEVHSEQEQIQTTSATVGSVVSGRTLTDLPLTARNYTTLLGLTAGASVSVFNAAGMGRGTQDIVVNGSSPYQNNYQQDGATLYSFSGRGLSSDGGANIGVGIVNPDSIQEYKIQASQFDAGYGRNPGANVNVVTKSGGNQFHGDAFEFFRNTALNANDYFRKLNPSSRNLQGALVSNNGRQVLNQNQFGGTFGGPIKKDRLFVFGSYQETRQKNGISPSGGASFTLLPIPTGDRSTPAFKAALGAAFCGGKTSIGGTQVACDGSNINPVAVNLLNLKLADGSYYIPSSPTAANLNVNYSSPATYGEHQALANVDYVIDSKNTLSYRWFLSDFNTVAPIGCGSNASGTTLTSCLPGAPGTIHGSNNYSVLKLTSILSTNVVNEAKVSLQRSIYLPHQGVPYTDTQVGISPIIPGFNVLNSISVAGSFQIGGLLALSSTQSPSAWQAGDQISWSHGKHTLRTGFEYERMRNNPKLPSIALGSETFQTMQDLLIGLPGCSPVSFSNGSCSASHPVDPFTGILTNGTAVSNILNTGVGSVTPASGLQSELRNAAADAFVQDDFKFSNSLTLNLGVRWEWDGIFYDHSGLLGNVWNNLILTVPVPGPTPATGTLAGFVVPSNYNFADFPLPAVGGLFQNNKKISTQNSPPIDNFAPRFGMAWKPFAGDRFVVRAGFGFFFDQPAQHSFEKASTQGEPYSVTLGSFAQTQSPSLAQPYPAGALPGFVPRWINFATGQGSSLNDVALGPVLLTPVTYQWNLNVQYEFLPTWVLELGYVGSHGIHQVSNQANDTRNINESQLIPQGGSICGQGTCITTNTVANAPLRVPYLGFTPSGLGADETNEANKFNSLQVTVRKQLSHGFSMQAAYTYARSFDTSYGTNYDDPLKFVYGLNGFYHPQRVAISYTWDLPFGHYDGFMGKLTNGWNVSGVTVRQDGTPLTIVDSSGMGAYGLTGAVSATAEFNGTPGNHPAIGTTGGLEQRLGGNTGGPGYLNVGAFLPKQLPIVGAVNGGPGGTGYGNSGFGIFLGPGQFNFDATIQKTTKVGGINENANLVFRTEFFNMFNHAQFNPPSGSQLDVTKSVFGQITSTSVNPRLIQFALKYVF